MPRSPTPSNTPSVWVDALCAWPTLTRCPTQASGIPFSDIAASLRGLQLRLQHSEAFAPQHLGGSLVLILAHPAVLQRLGELRSDTAFVLVSLTLSSWLYHYCQTGGSGMGGRGPRTRRTR